MKNSIILFFVVLLLLFCSCGVSTKEFSNDELGFSINYPSNYDCSLKLPDSPAVEFSTYDYTIGVMVNKSEPYYTYGLDGNKYLVQYHHYSFDLIDSLKEEFNFKEFSSSDIGEIKLVDVDDKQYRVEIMLENNISIAYIVCFDTYCAEEDKYYTFSVVLSNNGKDISSFINEFTSFVESIEFNNKLEVF